MSQMSLEFATNFAHSVNENRQLTSLIINRTNVSDKSCHVRQKKLLLRLITH